MANYRVNYNKTGADSVLCHLEMLADSTTPRRGKVSDVLFGNTATPADALFQYTVRRITNSGTGTTVTPAPVDAADAVALFDAEHLITVDPASFGAGTELLRVPLNHRATFRWIANPGEELVWPATATNGLGVGVTAASTSTFSGSVSVNEQ
jgi:hypothetical protein